MAKKPNYFYITIKTGKKDRVIFPIFPNDNERAKLLNLRKNREGEGISYCEVGECGKVYRQRPPKQ